MRARSSLVFALAALLAAEGAAAQVAPKAFDLPGPAGGRITGQADFPETPSTTAVLMVAGTGGFDRDARFGASGTERDMIFRDLSKRMTARGLMTVRYDRRGVDFRNGKTVLQHGRTGDPAVLATITDVTQADDYRAVFDWAKAKDGLGATCVIVFLHSEGTVHAAIAAERGAAAPLLVIGMGAPMTDKKSDFEWKAVDRTAESLIMMDADKDGSTTEAEVRAGFAKTPAAVMGDITPFLPPPGQAWSRAQIEEVRAVWRNVFEQGKAQVLAHPDADPYPDAANVQASYGWWKSWYLDAKPMGERFAAWKAPFSLHFGTLDSQVRWDVHSEAAKTYVPAERLTLHIHPALGHTLGRHVTYGPIEEEIADAIADEAAEAAKGCR